MTSLQETSFHISGRAATTALFDRLGRHTGTHVLDVGSFSADRPVSGPDRHAQITGVDVTPEFVEVAAS
jgi:hypothetical protein